MKTYEVTLSNLRNISVRTRDAADAIQFALMNFPGLTVVGCNCPGMSYDIPAHKALTIEDVERLTPKREKRAVKPYGNIDDNKPAPWIQGWMDKRSRA